MALLAVQWTDGNLNISEQTKNITENILFMNLNVVLQQLCNSIQIYSPGTTLVVRCINIPNFASLYQPGMGLESILSQFGLYLFVKTTFAFIRTQQIKAMLKGEYNFR